MIRYTSDRQLTLEGFSLPFGGKLNPENRWIKWNKGNAAKLAQSIFLFTTFCFYVKK